MVSSDAPKENEGAQASEQSGALDERQRAEARSRARAALELKRTCAATDDQFMRPANEDDDGYDPYSDRIEQPQTYEEDPWR